MTLLKEALMSKTAVALQNIASSSVGGPGLGSASAVSRRAWMARPGGVHWQEPFEGKGKGTRVRTRVWAHLITDWPVSANEGAAAVSREKCYMRSGQVLAFPFPFSSFLFIES